MMGIDPGYSDWRSPVDGRGQAMMALISLGQSRPFRDVRCMSGKTL